MKKYCSCCNKELKLFSEKYTLQDGILCLSCLESLEKVGMADIIERLPNTNINKLKEIYKSKRELANMFEIESRICEILIIDYTNQLLIIDNILLKFSNLKDAECKFQYSEITNTNTRSKTKKGIGKSLVGGFLFGPVGALVGGMTSKGKTKSSSQTIVESQCSSAKLSLTLQNYYISRYFVTLSPSKKELRQTGCCTIEEYGEFVEAELKNIINNLRSED